MPRVYAPYADLQRRRTIRIGIAALVAAFAVFVTFSLWPDDEALSKTAEPVQVLPSTETRPVLIPADLTVPPSTELRPINTLPPGATVFTTAVFTTAAPTTPVSTTAVPTTTEPATTAPTTAGDPDGSPDERFAAALAATIEDHPVMASRDADQLRTFVDSICKALTDGANQDFITADLDRQAGDKGWTADLVAGIEALRQAGTAALCPAFV